MRLRNTIAIVSLGLSLSLIAATAHGQTVLDSNEAARTVEVRNVNVSENVITGEVVNRSPHLLQNVELLLQFHWLWKNERHPQENSLGRSVFLTLDRNIRPGESAAFTFKPDPPLPARPDGQYMAEVTLAGFAVVVSPEMDAR